MINIAPVPPQYLHKWWGDVLPDIDECRRHDKEMTWAEDVYHAIRSGHATLYVGTDGGRYCGMMVATVHTDQWDPERRWLHVWYCNTRPGVDGLIEAGMSVLEQHARSIGAEMITFRADRLAFERWGKALGFHVGEIELRREVSHG